MQLVNGVFAPTTNRKIIRKTFCVTILILVCLSVFISKPSHSALIVYDINKTLDSSSYYQKIDIPEWGDFDLYHDSNGGVSIFHYSGSAHVEISTVRGEMINNFAAGDSVDASWFDGTNGDAAYPDTDEYLYFSRNIYRWPVIIGLGAWRPIFVGTEGQWSEVGSHGYLGMRRWDSSQGQYQYGWMEVTRGSIIIGQVGIQTTHNTQASIPNEVPEPSTLLILAIGIWALLRAKRSNSNVSTSLA